MLMRGPRRGTPEAIPTTLPGVVIWMFNSPLRSLLGLLYLLVLGWIVVEVTGALASSIGQVVGYVLTTAAAGGGTGLTLNFVRRRRGGPPPPRRRVE